MKKYLLMFVVFVFIPLCVFAQPRGKKMQRPIDRLESLKKVRMLETMKLDEDQSAKLVACYNKHRETIKSFEKDRSDIVDKIETQVSSNVSDGEYQKSFVELIEIEKKIIDARTKYISDLKEVLTTKQIAQYLIFERNFAREIRDMILNARRDHMDKE